MKKLLAFLALFLVFESRLWADAASLVNVVQLDFGNPANPTMNAPRAGSPGVAYLTLKNRGARTLENLFLNLEKGKCLLSLGPAVRIPRLGPGEQKRLSDALQIQFDPACQPGADVSFLLVGAFQFAGDGQQHYVWVTHHLPMPSPGKQNRIRSSEKATKDESASQTLPRG